MVMIGVDLGGTNLASGVVTTDGILQGRIRSVPTCTESVSGLIGQIASEVRALMAEQNLTDGEVTAVGIGVPGTANLRNGHVEYANNLGMEDEPFLEPLQELLPGMKIFFENDANAAAWAEYRLGAGAGSSSMVMVTLGTGIGGGIIIGGEMFEGINYACGEFGHMVIDRNGIPCNCGRRGCFECYASASALVRQTREAMDSAKDSLLWELCGQDPERMDGRLLFDAVRAGDPTAKKVLEEFTGYLGIGITDVINMLQPEVLVVGGGISRAGDLLLEPVRIQAGRGDYARMSARRTKIIPAELGNDAGIIGAALLAGKQCSKG